METLRYWLRGIRFYIAYGSVLVTVLVAWWAHAAYAGTILYPTRVEEIYAWLAIGLLALALSIGPLLKLFKNMPGRSLLFDARRLIGVSAAWFALLHGTIAYFSLFKGANPLSLPREYQKSFVIGGIALLILLAMAFTSFDKAFNKMGKWWFRLHRFVYPAAGLALLHAFLTGTHSMQLSVLFILSTVCALLIVAYLFIMFKKSVPSIWQIITVASMTVFLVLVLGYGFTQHTSHNKSLASVGAALQ